MIAIFLQFDENNFKVKMTNKIKINLFVKHFDDQNKKKKEETS